ncbi:hypothetical protein E4U15_000208 [Claviceps sp. LM218 group G6]|nr:hypothetical protein E4U15_000208 [Claviceps sp. LM218 group G6]
MPRRCSAFPTYPDDNSSSPVLMQGYANRPLPRLPSSAFSMPETTGFMEIQTQIRRTNFGTERGESSEFHSSALSIGSMLPTQQYHNSSLDTTTFPRDSLGPRSNYRSPARCSRRSSHKVHQLIGLQVDVMDNQMMSLDSLTTAGPKSYYTRSEPKPNERTTRDCGLVPFLGADNDANSSRESSWGPMSPESDSIPAPLNIHKSLGGENCNKMDGMGEDFLQMGLTDVVLLSAHDQFSDDGAAGEYHRFTADLAIHDSRRSKDFIGDGVVPSITSSMKKRSSLSLGFSAATLFSRRRERSHSVQIPSISKGTKRAHQEPSQPHAGLIAGPAYKSASEFRSFEFPIDVAPPRPPPAPPLMSAWDSDSDNDEMPVISSLKDWFAHRNTEETKGLRHVPAMSRINSDSRLQVSWLGDGRKEALAHRQEREKQIKIEKAEKRREAIQGQLKKSFATIPNDFGFSSSRFT